MQIPSFPIYVFARMTLLILPLTLTTAVGQEAREIVRQGEIHLPEFYGTYAINGGKTVELKGNAAPIALDARVEFVVFDKQIPLVGGADVLKLYRLPAVSPRPVAKDNGEFKGWDDWFKKSDRHVTDMNATITGVPVGSTPVELRVKPIANQAEMIRVIPRENLSDGTYQLGKSIRFTVGNVPPPVRRRPDSQEASEASARNLMYIGMTVMVYANDRGGKCPADMAEVLSEGLMNNGRTSPDKFVFPGREEEVMGAWERRDTKDSSGAPCTFWSLNAVFKDASGNMLMGVERYRQWLKTTGDYVYIAGGQKLDGDKNHVIAYERFTDQDESVAVLFADIRVETMKVADLVKLASFKPE